MNQEAYPFIGNPNNAIYTFTSVGKRGSFTKTVVFQSLYQNLYNLILADYDNQTGSFNDKSITNNGDLVTVLTTVIQIIQDFTTQNPDAFVYIEGNTPIKQRLYNRIVNRSLPDIETLYGVSGILPDGDKEAFALNVDYIAIILEPKY